MAAKYELPKFGDDKNKDPFESILKLTLAQHQQMKKVLKYKEQLLNGTKLKKTL